jgi:NACalpha-BTF3-like transcription factor
MGFPKAKARKALEKNGYDVEAAVHWIVVNT